MDGREDTTEKDTTDSHLGQLERGGAGMSDDPCTDLDQSGLQAGQRPSGHLL